MDHLCGMFTGSAKESARSMWPSRAGSVEAALLFENRNTFDYAAIADMCGISSDKTRDIVGVAAGQRPSSRPDRKSTRLNSSHPSISYAVFCLKKKKNIEI